MSVIVLSLGATTDAGTPFAGCIFNLELQEREIAYKST